MTRSTDDNNLPACVSNELNQFDIDNGKNFKILPSNDQIKGKIVEPHFLRGIKILDKCKQ